jgi:nitrite reductase/ring-hydroxylating ferredoxin subunit/flavin-dependent dehydrogenase
MAKIIQHEGGMIYEHTEATEFSDDPLSVTANGHQIQADYIIIATHVPLMGNSGLMSASFLQTKLAPHSSYVIGAKIPDNVFPEALFWDTSDPYFYLRIDQRASGDYAIFGGLDHKTGQADNPQSRFDELEQRLKKIIPEARTERRWSGQVIESNDGLPYIGETAPSQFAATGFCGNGMTFGTLAAMMACDAVEGRQNPWKELFAMERKTLSSGWNYLRENFDYPYYLLRDRLAGSESGQPEDLDRGCGKVLSINGQRVACSRDRSGRLNYVSAICSHMGCVVHWNNAAETWDCPCHGSRFEPTGKVIAGPAEQGLEKVTVDNAASLT